MATILEKVRVLQGSIEIFTAVPGQVGDGVGA